MLPSRSASDASSRSSSSQSAPSLAPSDRSDPRGMTELADLHDEESALALEDAEAVAQEAGAAATTARVQAAAAVAASEPTAVPASPLVRRAPRTPALVPPPVIVRPPAGVPPLETIVNGEILRLEETLLSKEAENVLLRARVAELVVALSEEKSRGIEKAKSAAQVLKVVNATKNNLAERNVLLEKEKNEKAAHISKLGGLILSERDVSTKQGQGYRATIKALTTDRDALRIKVDVLNKMVMQYGPGAPVPYTPPKPPAKPIEYADDPFIVSLSSPHLL